MDLLRQKLSKDTLVLTKEDPGFSSAHERWSDIDRETPSVIVQPASEHDVTVLVRTSFIANTRLWH